MLAGEEEGEGGGWDVGDDDLELPPDLVRPSNKQQMQTNSKQQMLTNKQTHKQQQTNTNNQQMHINTNKQQTTNKTSLVTRTMFLAMEWFFFI